MHWLCTDFFKKKNMCTDFIIYYLINYRRLPILQQIFEFGIKMLSSVRKLIKTKLFQSLIRLLSSCLISFWNNIWISHCYWNGLNSINEAEWPSIAPELIIKFMNNPGKNGLRRERTAGPNHARWYAKWCNYLTVKYFNFRMHSVMILLTEIP